MTNPRIRALWLTLMLAILMAGCGGSDVRTDEPRSPAAEPAQAVSTTTLTGSENPVGDSPSERPSLTEPMLDNDQGQGIGILVNSNYVDFPDLAHLAWASTLIVLGEIVEEHEGQRLNVTDPILEADPQIESSNHDQIYTDFVVRIDKHYRGLQQDTVTLRMLGGTVGDVTVIHESVPDLFVGDEIVLFLEPQAPIFDGDMLVLNGGPQGLWWVRDGTVEPADAGPVESTMSIADFETMLSEVLHNPPPEDMTLADGTLAYISIEDAPPGTDLPELPN